MYPEQCCLHYNNYQQAHQYIFCPLAQTLMHATCDCELRFAIFCNLTISMEMLSYVRFAYAICGCSQRLRFLASMPPKSHAAAIFNGSPNYRSRSSDICLSFHFCLYGHIWYQHFQKFNAEFQFYFIRIVNLCSKHQDLLNKAYLYFMIS